jgi:hypothetical protein
MLLKCSLVPSRPFQQPCCSPAAGRIIITQAFRVLLGKLLEIMTQKMQMLLSSSVMAASSMRKALVRTSGGALPSASALNTLLVRQLLRLTGRAEVEVLCLPLQRKDILLLLLWLAFFLISVCTIAGS